VGRKWICDDYASLIEQGGFNDIDELNLVKSISGRINATLKFGQKNYDSMEESHRKMLAAVLSVVLYHRN